MVEIPKGTRIVPFNPKHYPSDKFGWGGGYHRPEWVTTLQHPSATPEHVARRDPNLSEAGSAPTGWHSDEIPGKN